MTLSGNIKKLWRAIRHAYKSQNKILGNKLLIMHKHYQILGTFIRRLEGMKRPLRTIKDA